MRRFSLIAVLTLLVVAASVSVAVAGGFRPVAGNPADKLVNLPIDDYQYDHAKDCRKNPTPGANALVAWLNGNAGGSFWGIMRCERWGKGRASLHAEGRAIDWHLNVHNGADRREAKRLINLLLAPDRAGNQHALARRMGVQEIIWDCRSWFGGGWGDEQRLERYSPCYGRKGRPVKIDDTTAHRDHVHLGLTRRGARRLTSFWSRTAPPASVAEAATGA
jgi:hypothetical protein